MFNTTITISEETAELKFTSPNPLTDQQVIDGCKKSPTGNIFQSIYGGHWENAGYQSQIEADEAFCDMLAIHTQNELQIDRIISGSGHYNEDWHSNPEYKAKVIRDAREQAKPKIAKKDDPQNKYFNEKNKFIPKFLADEILKNHHFITMAGSFDIYHYEDGVYIPNGKNILDQLALEKLSYCFNRRCIDELTSYVEIQARVSRDLVNNEPFVINLKNGLYDVRTGQFKPHTPDFLSTSQIPVDYDPNAKCHNIDKFLSDVVSEEDKQVLLEWIGYLLVPDTRMQKAVMIYGSGSNGKGVLFDLLNRFIGMENISCESLQNLEKEKFSKANLYGKLLNIFPDLPSSSLHEDSTFKCLVSGDTINGEYKYKNAFSFKNTARLMFSANNLPELKKDDKGTYAFYRRWMLISFPNMFEGENNDIDLIYKLTTPNELSGLLNKALLALRYLLKNGDFSYKKTVKEIERLYKLEANSTKVFAEECIESSDKDLLKSTLREKYLKWSGKNGITPVAENTLGRELKGLGYTYERETAGDRLYYWKEMSLKSI